MPEIFVNRFPKEPEIVPCGQHKNISFHIDRRNLLDLHDLEVGCMTCPEPDMDQNAVILSTTLIHVNENGKDVNVMRPEHVRL
jgi:uncharacterized protein (UPF0212 family)